MKNFFNLKESFELTDDEYDRLMIEGHRPEVLMSYEETPLAFKFFEHLPDVNVMLFDRPWNRDFEPTNTNYMRCNNWEEIRRNIN